MSALRAVLALAAVALAACGGSAGGALPPDVILISIDTLRADHLACYGYELETSPALDRFAAQATRYARAQATAPWTVPSHASMFTGLYPFEHGAHTLRTKRPGLNVPPLSPDALTLAEVLRAAGYRTAGYAANKAFLAAPFGLGQGFDVWDVEFRRAARTHERVLPLLRGEREQPLLLFLNYMETHRPYASEERPGFLPRPVGRDSAELLDALYTPVLSGEPRADSPEMQRLVDQYDTAIANLDEELGRFFDELRALGRFDDALIVVTSDHGEFFGEHALIEHSKDVYQGALAVPLIVKLPGQREGRVDERPISIASIPELVLAGLPPELRREHGSALPGPDRGTVVLSESYFSRSKDLFGQPWGDRFRRVRRVAFDGRWKYVQSSDGKDELYDLVTDPLELEDRLETEPAHAERLKAELRSRLENPRRAAGEPAEVAPVDEEDLKKVGYL